MLAGLTIYPDTYWVFAEAVTIDRLAQLKLDPRASGRCQTYDPSR